MFVCPFHSVSLKTSNDDLQSATRPTNVEFIPPYKRGPGEQDDSFFYSSLVAEKALTKADLVNPQNGGAA